MSDEKTTTTIVVINKKKAAHGGHHGGAWKVAYADFVTAMMALFIVLWLMNTSDTAKEAISAYFRDPSGKSGQTGSGVSGVSGETVNVGKDDMETLKDKLQAAMKRSPEFDKLKDYVHFSVTGDGLRIEMTESDAGKFFQSGSPIPTSTGEEMIRRMAGELGKLPNDLLIEGHTDSRPFGIRKDYTNWELSTDRANAARRIMEANGLREGQVGQVRGFADRHLREPDNPDAPSNRRITVIVKYQNAPEDAPDSKGPEKGSEAKAVKGKSAEHN